MVKLHTFHKRGAHIGSPTAWQESIMLRLSGYDIMAQDTYHAIRARGSRDLFYPSVTRQGAEVSLNVVKLGEISSGIFQAPKMDGRWRQSACIDPPKPASR